MDLDVRTVVRSQCLIVHDCTRKVNLFQYIPVPSPILPVEKYPSSNGSNQRHFHRLPFGRARNLCHRGLLAWSQHSALSRGEGENWSNSRTSVCAGDVVSPSSSAIFNNAKTASFACSGASFAKMSICSLTFVRVASVVESSIQVNASCLMYRSRISSYLRLASIQGSLAVLSLTEMQIL